MADPESHASRAEQRAVAVAKLRRAASLPRMKDGRRPPMHSESVSEGEKSTPTPPLNGTDHTTPEPNDNTTNDSQATESDAQTIHHDPQEKKQDDDEPPQLPDVQVTEAEAEADVDTEDRSFSPGPARSRRRPRSRSRSRNSKDFKGKNRGAPSPTPHIAGDSSPDEAPPMPIALPILPPLFTPIPSPFGLQPHRFLPSPDPSMFYTGPSNPSTPLPLPTLEALQKGLMRSNSAGSTAASRKLAMAKLTGGTETYEPSPSPTPPPLPGSRLARNNTVAGGERIAARQIMLGRLAGRVAKEADAEQQASGEERGAPSPTLNKRRRRRSRRGSSSAAANAPVSDSDPVSTPSHTPHPPTPYTIPQDYLQGLRALSATPNQASSSRNQSSERIVDLNAQADVEHEPQEHRRRSVLVEDDEEEGEEYYQAPPRSRTPAITPPYRASPHISNFRAIHSSDSPASHSSDSVPAVNGLSTVPVYIGKGSPTRDQFPSSPFTTPLKEKQLLSDDDEQVLYRTDTLRPRTPASAIVPISDSRPRTPHGTDRDAYDRQISWVASPVPEINLPIDDVENDEDDDDDEHIGAEVPVQDDRAQYQDYDEPPQSPTSVNEYSQYASPRASASSTSVTIESEASADINHIIGPSQFTAIPVSQSTSYSQQTDELSTPNGEVYADWLTRELSTKASVEGASSPSRWEKVKNTFSRSTSSVGRRSRSNSIINRERNSSISRESGVSLTSAGKGERGDSFVASTQQQPVAPPLMLSPSASASISSLGPPSYMRGNPSPIPPVSDADRSKYQSDKLFPFPGMYKLEEQRRDRARGAFPAGSTSTPDVSAGAEEVTTPLSAHSFASHPQTPDLSQDGKLSHQASDPRLNVKAGQDRPGASPSRQYIDLIPLNTSTSSSSSKHKLPMTFTDVKQWLSKNKGKKASTPAITPPAPVAMSASLDSQLSTESGKQLKTALTDFLQSNATDSEWEGRTPTTDKPPPRGQTVNIFDFRSNGRDTPAMNGTHTDTERTPKAKKILPLNVSASTDSRYQVYQDTPVEVAKPDRYMSPTPDLNSSTSELPAQSTSESSSTSSQFSMSPTAQAITLLQRLDDALARGPVPIDTAPRKLLFSSPVLQVVNPNTVKDRFLFIFNDILVIAKPIIQDHGTLIETPSIIPTDRKYIVKSIVRFRDLRLCPDRNETAPKSFGASSHPRSPLLQTFIADFSHDAEHAIIELLSKSHIDHDPQVTGQVLFKTQELNRKALGDYLCRRSSKSILKAFLDNFGFGGLRIDVALRVFLHSIHIPQIPGMLEYLLDSFASRWYEANAQSVACDRDTAVRLVRAIGQLNELLHGTIADEVGPTGPVRRNITMKDFYDAFRRYDPGRSVSDDLLADVYSSIRQERLSQGRSQVSPGLPDLVISIRRPLPTRLTYKIQSDPVIIRLPQPDPSLTLQLFGEDLTIEPSVLTFAKTPEASFRITGTSLGSKSLFICRSGPNAIKYTGLPLTYTIPVERGFMRNTFQIAFLDHKKMKRRYMFSLESHSLYHSIKSQIETSMATPPPASTENPIPGASDFSRAAEEVAFTVLQETLIGSHPSPLPQNGHSGHSAGYLSAPKDLSLSPSHRRSKSRSKLYPRQGAGRLEFDLNNNSHHYNTSHDSNDTTDIDDNTRPYDQNGKAGSKFWSSREIELQCQQNGLIPAVLAHLQSVTGTS